MLIPGVLLSCASANAAEFAAQKIIMQDEYGVNVASTQVVQSLNTVSIGGENGISHSISTATNNFEITGYRGYRDKFLNTKASYVYIGSQGSNQNVYIQGYGYVLDAMRFSDFEGSTDFIVRENGNVVTRFSELKPTYAFEALSDPRNSLKFTDNNTYLEWTKPNGTKSRYKFYPMLGAELESVIFPTGLRYDIGARKEFGNVSYRAVTTNTGFELLYKYEIDTRPYSDPGVMPVYAPLAQPETWSYYNPKYVYAINAAIENCNLNSGGCFLTKDWPRATFNWPAGMPRAMYFGTNIFSVANGLGEVTEYKFKAYDLHYCGLQGAGSNHTYALNERTSPRLVEIKPPYASQAAFKYEYKNVCDDFFDMMGIGHGSDLGVAGSMQLVAEAGQIYSAKKNDSDVHHYTVNYENTYGTVTNSGGGEITQVRMAKTIFPFTLVSASTTSGTMSYEGSFFNAPKKFSRNKGPSEDYEYTRGNLTKIILNKGKATEVYMQAQFPVACDSSNYKYCNKPVWQRDARGNVTSYTYHQPSGQVESVKSPADKNGKIAEIRYEYEQKPAYYYSTNGARVSGSPIWLRVAERRCENSNYASTNCELNDELVTSFEYNNDNLLMTSKSVYSQRENKTLTICYQYDIYGNRIGETSPNSNLSVCN
ncbi:hypothetical protein HPT27_00025 [Permianibacter sp. IMCC34836]|uniref:hypothetical protein n=1 Tax=Permianibacter fluminis TaxID=2738515 RepID=UPI001556C212|nr:hypothetical protein [Permianibacter fluminis]NQD35387.1 hypothetical protein [Permianibacter fluminis]